MKGVCVHKEGRIHPSTKLLAGAFGMEDYYVYRGKGLFGKIPKLGDFTGGRKAARDLTGYDVCFFEGLSCAPLLPSLKKQGICSIAKGNSHEIFFMENRRGWKSAFNMLNLDKNLHGMIAVSEMIKEDFQRHFNFPIEVAEGFMYRKYEDLAGLKQNLSQRNFLFIGNNNPWIKGLDTMIEIFINLKKERVIPDETLFYIAGSYSDDWVRGIFSPDVVSKSRLVLLGGVENIFPYLKDSFFQFHLARYEPNAVALMEGMAAGLLPLVSEKTGNKSFITTIDPGLIVNAADKREACEKITSILNYQEKDLFNLKEEFMAKSSRYASEAGISRWKGSWKRLLSLRG